MSNRLQKPIRVKISVIPELIWTKSDRLDVESIVDIHTPFQTSRGLES